jgi:PmbA protein
MEQNQALELCDLALQASGADQTEVSLSWHNSALTRFAGNAIHQNVAEVGSAVRIRAVVGKKIGLVSGTDLSPEALRQLAREATEVARLSAADEDFVSLPGPLPYDGETNFADLATAQATPEQRAEGVRRALEPALQHNLTAAGAYTTGHSSYAVCNSLGVVSYQESAAAELSLVVEGSDSAGYARTSSPLIADLDAAALGKRATDKCLASANPREIEPGVYPVILEEEAVADMAFMLAIYDFGALAVQEGRSCMGGHFGEQLCGTNVNLWDDGLDPRGRRMAYDFEGLTKQRVDLIREGVATDVVWDSYTAGREGRQSTGHALPAPNTFGPVPINLFVGTGDSDLQTMIVGLERGILVTRFHYTNMIHPLQTSFTGMTRDGTFLVEDGRIVCGLKNLRFTQSILEALSQVSAISRTGKLTDYAWAPAMQIEAFSFSS